MGAHCSDSPESFLEKDAPYARSVLADRSGMPLSPPPPTDEQRRAWQDQTDVTVRELRELDCGGGGRVYPESAIPAWERGPTPS